MLEVEFITRLSNCDWVEGGDRLVLTEFKCCFLKDLSSGMYGYFPQQLYYNHDDLHTHWY